MISIIGKINIAKLCKKYLYNRDKNRNWKLKIIFLNIEAIGTTEFQDTAGVFKL